MKGGLQYYEQEDGLGSVAEVRDSSGGLVGQTRYDGWGVGTVANGTERSGQRFAGQRGYQDDDGTGVQWLGSRYYVPQLGRFLTPDPIGQEGGLNLYAYCEDSPLMATDAKGTQLEGLMASGGLGGWSGGAAIASAARDVGRGAVSWPLAIGVALHWFNGTFPSEVYYDSSDPMGNAFVHSGTAADIEHQIRVKNYMPAHGWMTGGVKTWSAFRHSMMEVYNGAEFQAGAVSFHAQRNGGRVYIDAYNDITAYSGLFHNPRWFGLPNELPYGLPMGTVRQHYFWSIPIPGK